MSILPVFLALLSASLYALVVHSQRKGIGFVDARTGAFVMVCVFAGIYGVIVPFVLEWSWIPTRATLVFAICGMLVPATAQQLQFMSVQKLGPSLTATFVVVAPLAASIPSVIFLDEPFNLQAAVGLGLLVLGIGLSVWARHAAAKSFALILILLPISAATLRGLVQPAMKFGLLENPNVFYASWIMSTSAAMYLACFQLFRARSSIQIKYERGLGWIILAGVFMCTAFTLHTFALRVGDVVIVAPLIATMPLWAVAFGVFVFKHETITQKQALGAAIATVGAIVLVTR